jgi:ABC-type uncharacterized transport system ATPase subunit
MNQIAAEIPGSALLAEMRGIDKSFPGVIANAGVDLDIRPGEVHALLGENGAGKSTLMNILTGIYQPDAGTIHIDGKAVSFRSPRDAIAAGIGMVHQHFKLVKAFSVAENLHLGLDDTPFLVSRSTLRKRTQVLEQRFGLQISPDAIVQDLSAGEQQRVEILKALVRGARILILDEPTAVLTADEARLLFDVVRRLTASGFAVIFISHKLDEVLAISDRITVLRGGRKIATVAKDSTNNRNLADLMVGHAVTPRGNDRRPMEHRPAIALHGVSTSASQEGCRLDGVDLTLFSGEITGIVGVAGNGQRELSEVLTGIRTPDAGAIRIQGVDFTDRDAKAFAKGGVGHIPEDRLRSGVAASLSLLQNAILREYDMPPISSGPWIKSSHARRFASSLLAAAHVSAPSIAMPLRNLSGGNQQRFVVARETRIASQVLIAAYPTRGLDIAAAETVRAELLALRNKGIAVLIISEDLDELMSLSDRLIVMYGGRLIGERTPPWNRNELGLLMGGVLMEVIADDLH